MVAFISIVVIIAFGLMLGKWGKVMDKCLDSNIKANEMKIKKENKN